LATSWPDSPVGLDFRGIGDQINREQLEKKWIFNLSMHFRDQSDREKFFITYAEQPDKWQRVTISCDYRNAPEDSLESDLKSLHFQRDKSARIYESIVSASWLDLDKDLRVAGGVLARLSAYGSVVPTALVEACRAAPLNHIVPCFLPRHISI